MGFRNKIRGLKEVWAFDNRLWLTFAKTFFPQENLHVYRYKGFDILIDRAGGDANGAREVLLSPMYRRFLSKMKTDGPANVLDLGANNGGFPLLLAAEGIALKRVVSVEFNPQTFVRLQFNLTRNLGCELFPVNAALCGEERTIRTTLGQGSVSDNIYAVSGDASAKAVSIDGLTLDHFFKTYFDGEVLDICKIDVEEAEFEVFSKPHHGSITRCRYLIMEIHERGERRKEEIVPVLESLGFALQQPDPDADPTVHFFVNSKLN